MESSTKAALKVIEKTGIDPLEIGCIVSTSVCKDYIEPSAMASIVHGELGLSPAASTSISAMPVWPL